MNTVKLASFTVMSLVLGLFLSLERGKAQTPDTVASLAAKGFEARGVSVIAFADAELKGFSFILVMQKGAEVFVCSATNESTRMCHRQK